MSIYVFYNRDGKLRFFTCNMCGSVNLCKPHNSESDHRNVLRFTCNNCNNKPYWRKMDISDVIKITKSNEINIRKEICEQHNYNVENYEWRQDMINIIQSDS